MKSRLSRFLLFLAVLFAATSGLFYYAWRISPQKTSVQVLFREGDEYINMWSIALPFKAAVPSEQMSQMEVLNLEKIKAVQVVLGGKAQVKMRRYWDAEAEMVPVDLMPCQSGLVEDPEIEERCFVLPAQHYAQVDLGGEEFPVQWLIVK